jgi:biopolymer transport protein ExbD
MRFRRGLKQEATVNLIPLIDVMFVIIIFFMLTTTFIIAPGINIELPASTTATNVPMENLLISVVSEDEIYFGKTRVDLAGLGRELSDYRKTGSTTTKDVIIEGAKDIPYSLMIGVLDVVRQNGFTGANLRTRAARGAGP